MKKHVRSFVTGALVCLLCLAVPLMARQDQGKQSKPDNEIGKYLTDHNVKLAPGSRVLRANLFTLSLPSKKMVVRSQKLGKMLVLALDDEVKTMDGEKEVETATLKRGDDLILVLSEKELKVREIFKFK